MYVCVCVCFSSEGMDNQWIEFTKCLLKNIKVAPILMQQHWECTRLAWHPHVLFSWHGFAVISLKQLSGTAWGSEQAVVSAQSVWIWISVLEMLWVLFVCLFLFCARCPETAGLCIRAQNLIIWAYTASNSNMDLFRWEAGLRDVNWRTACFAEINHHIL